MAGPEVGDIYLQTHADTKGLAAEIRAAGKTAGKAFGAEFSKGTDQSLSGIGNQIRDKLGGDRLGRMTAKEFADNFTDGLKQRNWDFDIDLGKAIRTGDFGPMIKDVEDVNAQLERMRARITSLGDGGAFTKLGTDAQAVQKQLTAYVNELNRAAQEQVAAKESADDLAASQKKQAAGLAASNAATKETARIIVAQIKAQTKLAKANEAAAGKEQAAQLKRNQAAMAAMNKEIAEGIKYSEQLARSGNLNESTKSTNAYADAVKDTAAQLREMQTQLNKMGSAKGNTAGQTAAIKDLSDQVKEATGQFTVLQRASRDATVGMDKGTADFGAAMERNTARVRAFADSLKGIEAEIQVRADYPPKAEAAAQGATLGDTFADAFNRSTSGGAKGDSFFKPLQSEWNQFLYAFPAEVTLILRYFAVIGSELGAIGSAVGSTLTAGVASLGTAVVGLGAAAGATFPAMAYGIALAKSSMDEFEDSFPATSAAIDRLKDSFSQVDVPAFAAQWEGSVRKFANTLATSLETDQIATKLGGVAAQITNAFTGVISSPAWTGFVGAMESTIPAALAGVGTGVASLAQALLPFLTAAAPLAQQLGERFAAWAGGLATSVNSAAGLQGLQDFFAQASVSVTTLVSLLGGLGSALGNVFSAGINSGNRMLGTLASLTAAFDAWSGSVAGQTALIQWFAQGERIFNALLPLLGAIGQMFASIVTPDTVAQTVNFINQLTMLVPVIGQILSVLSGLDVLGNLATLANSVLGAIQPIIPALTTIANTVGTAFAQLATSIGPVLTQAFSGLAPLFNQIATMIGPVIQGLMPVISALGAAFVRVASTVGAALVPVFAALMPVINQLAPVFAQLATTFGGVLAQAISAFAPVLAQLLPVIGQLAATIGSALMPIISALAPVFAQLAPIIGQIVTMFASTLMPIIVQLSPLIAQLVPIIGMLAQAFMPIVQTVMQVVAQLASALMPVIQALIPIIMQLAPAIVQLFIAFNPVLRVITLLLPVIMPLIQLIAQLVTWVLNLIAPLAPLINQILTVVAQFLGFNRAIGAVIGFFTRLVPWVAKVIGVFKSFGTGMANGIKAVSNFVAKGVQLFAKFVTTVVTKISGFVSRIAGFFSNMVSRVVTTITNFVARVVTGFVNLISKVVTTVSKGITNVVNFFVKLPGRVMDAISNLVSKMGTWWSNLFSGIVKTVSGGVDDVVNWFKGIPTKIVNALSGAGTLLLNVGEDIITGLWDGMKNIFGSVTGWLGDQMHKLPAPVKKVLGISSPSKVFAELGRNIMQGLAVGILEDGDDVVKAVTSVSKDVVAAQQKLVKEEADRIVEARKKQNDRIRASNKKNKSYLPTISRTEATKIANRNTATMRAMLSRTYNAVIKEQSKRSKDVSITTLLGRADRSPAALNAYVRATGATLRDLATARDAAATRLESANKRLSDAIKVRDDFAASVRDSAIAFASATSAAQAFGQKEFDAKDVTTKMREQLAKLKKFRSDVATLTRAGLNKTTLKQIVDAGVDGGSQLASALVSGGRAAVSETNSLQRQIAEQAKGLGTASAKTFYQAGVDSAKGLIAGITSQSKAITAAMTKLTDQLVKQVKKKLKIRSPSQVLADEIGAPMGQGIVEGLARQRPQVTALLSDIASTPVVVTRSNTNPGLSGVAAGQVVNIADGAIRVTPVQADPVLTAHAVLDRLALTLQ